jgi:pentatricopeptide repeat protein
MPALLGVTAAFQPISISTAKATAIGRCISTLGSAGFSSSSSSSSSWNVLKMAADKDSDAEEEASRLRQTERFQRAKQKAIQRKKYAEASQAFDFPTTDNLAPTTTTTTLGGGTAMIFEMARRMWSSNNSDTKNNTADSFSALETTTPPINSNTMIMGDRLGGLPRFRRPGLTGIANVNPQFRTQPPLMDSQGYAATIWKNVRKRDKPSLWRYALRTYDRMVAQQQQQQQQVSSSSSSSIDVIATVQRTTIHYEGALAATAKLGMWERAVEIFQEVEEQQAAQMQKLELQKQTQKRVSSCSNLRSSSSSGIGSISPTTTRTASSGRVPIKMTRSPATSGPSPKDLPVQVTDHMVTSLIRACVRASRQESLLSLEEETGNGNNQMASSLPSSSSSSSSSSPSKEDEQRERLALLALRRKPLDKAVEIAIERCMLMYDENDDEINNNNNMPYGCLRVEAHHVNPLAAAYMQLGLIPEANKLLHMLKNRKIGPEPEIKSDVRFNINDLGTKDKASYTLLVKGFVSQGDWVGAVDALADMTTAGLYPVNRHLNEWTEVSERKTKQRTTRGWKKKRDEFWLDSVR